MSKLSYQYDILNLTPANAQPVEANFTRTEDHINQEVVERDGSVAMRAQLKLVGDPIVALDAAPKQYVDQVLPIGLVMMWAAAVPPANGRWLLCDGAPLQTASYPELFAVIGYVWGGSGGTFNAPNYSGRVPLGASGTHAIAQTGGSEDASLPAHLHSMAHTHAGAPTNSVDINHRHAGVDHLHGPPSVSIAPHNHGPRGAGWVVYAPGSGQYLNFAVGGMDFNTPASTDDAALSITVGNTGAADRSLTSGFMDSNNAHAHTATVPAFSGNTTSTGVAPTGTNMQPFLATPFIIRCR